MSEVLNDCSVKMWNFFRKVNDHSWIVGGIVIILLFHFIPIWWSFEYPLFIVNMWVPYVSSALVKRNVEFVIVHKEYV